MTNIPDWAWERVDSMVPPNSLFSAYRVAFATYIAEHEEPPVDLLLIEATDLALGHEIWDTNADLEAAKSLAFVALRRGIELGKEGAA